MLSSGFEKVFQRWRRVLARQFETWGITAGRATEGALVVSPAERRIDSSAAAIEALADFSGHEPRLPAGGSLS